eukprot:4620586-Amphidinium_carterae.2
MSHLVTLKSWPCGGIRPEMLKFGHASVLGLPCKACYFTEGLTGTRFTTQNQDMCSLGPRCCLFIAGGKVAIKWSIALTRLMPRCRLGVAGG